MRNEEFIQLRLIQESQKLLEAKFYFPAYFLVSQGIETLGAFLDKKPLAAKAQSKKRFNLAIKELFNSDYKNLSANDWLYKQLRCNLSHMCSTGGFILLCSRVERRGKHLDELNGQRIFEIEQLVMDFHKACAEVITQLENGQLKQKPMAMSEISSHKA
jgi:hypothetical protein